MVNLIGNTQTKRGVKMAELVYKQIITDLKNKIFAGELNVLYQSIIKFQEVPSNVP